MIAIVLAAGKGTRMKSNIHKTLHKIGDKPILRRIYNSLKNEYVDKIIFILGDKKEQIMQEFNEEYTKGYVDFVFQNEQLGTAHAVLQAKDKILEYKKDVIVTNGDLPLITKESYSNMCNNFLNSNYDMMVVSCDLENPFGYGRIIREKDKLLDIVEEIECNDIQKQIKEVNAGIYLYKYDNMIKIFEQIDNKNNKGEYYITDTIKIYNSQNYFTGIFKMNDFEELLGVNTLKELYYVNKLHYKKINLKHLENGVKFLDIENTYIDDDVEIGTNTLIYPNVYIKGYTKIGNNCIIYQDTFIQNSEIFNNVEIIKSHINNSIIKEGVTIGPYANIRPNTILEKNVHIGNFVEIKKSNIDENSKCGHLTYIGDSNIGKNTNIGAGTITCNYDGKNKHSTNIGNNVFVGSNTIFVSPVNIGDNSLTAAGSVITKDVQEYSLVFGRSKQVELKNYYNNDKKGE